MGDKKNFYVVVKNKTGAPMSIAPGGTGKGPPRSYPNDPRLMRPLRGRPAVSIRTRIVGPTLAKKKDE
jgi:hypothetical protein